MRNRFAINIILSYVEGRSSINEFQKSFLENKDLQNLLKKRFDFSRIAYRQYNYNLYECFTKEYELKNNNWDNITCRFIIYAELVRWLEFFGYSFKKYSKYTDDYDFMLNIQPSWLDIVDDQGIFDYILDEVPKDLSYTKRVKWGKTKLKEMFRYDRTYPRWIQGAEWPIVNGKPLVFSHQISEKDSELVKFYFYDPDTGEEVIVEQFY